MNVGEEEGKGNILCQATYPLLKENKHINFIGNIEGRDVFMDKADVMVCEGFTGNIILKLAESLYDITQSKNIQHEYFDRFNFENYGGTPVLGVNKPVIIGHGISQAKSFKNMISACTKNDREECDATNERGTSIKVLFFFLVVYLSLRAHPPCIVFYIPPYSFLSALFTCTAKIEFTQPIEPASQLQKKPFFTTLPGILFQ